MSVIIHELCEALNASWVRESYDKGHFSNRFAHTHEPHSTHIHVHHNPTTTLHPPTHATVRQLQPDNVLIPTQLTSHTNTQPTPTPTPSTPPHIPCGWSHQNVAHIKTLLWLITSPFLCDRHTLVVGHIKDASWSVTTDLHFLVTIGSRSPRATQRLHFLVIG